MRSDCMRVSAKMVISKMSCPPHATARSVHIIRKWAFQDSVEYIHTALWKVDLVLRTCMEMTHCWGNTYELEGQPCGRKESIEPDEVMLLENTAHFSSPYK